MFMTAFFIMVKNLEEQVLYVLERSGKIFDKNSYVCFYYKHFNIYII